ncbi:MAG TPA: hypothetical protein VK485_11285 [Sphingomicrobium sp.]|nr:hypothetical protein [Sphingomicrobium sp.]
MTKLSIGQAWSETLQVAKREGRLIVPIALAFAVIPATLFALAAPQVPVGQMPESGPWALIYLLLILTALIGQMAIIRLAIGPATSVAESIRHSLRRFPSVFGAALIFGLPAAAIIVPAATPILANPTDPPPGPAFAFMVVCIVLLCLWVRLMLVTAAGVAEPIGPIAIIKRSWALTSGNFWRLLATILLFGLVAWVAIKAAEWVSGTALIVALGKPDPWTVSALLIALIAAITQTIASVLFAILLARIYAQRAKDQTNGQ